MYDYYPFGMPMPNRNIQDANAYRYAYQGQEKDPETGKEAFELRLWDGRIGRWLTTDPKGQYHSPYLGMGNNPIFLTDPDGGSTDDWYEKLDVDGNGTGTYEWFDGSYDIEGYSHRGFDMMVIDIDNNKTFYDGATKSSYNYNHETGNFDDLLMNYDNSNLLASIGNPILRFGDQFGKAATITVQAIGIIGYELTQGTDLEGLDFTRDLGYKPWVDINSTKVFNNGKWVNINLHSQGQEKFAEQYLIDTYKSMSKLSWPNKAQKGWEWLGKKLK